MVRIHAVLVFTVFEIQFLLKGSQSTADKKSSEGLVKRISHKYKFRMHVLPHSKSAYSSPHPIYKPWSVPHSAKYNIPLFSFETLPTSLCSPYPIILLPRL